jgi:hypothetical protein
MLSTKTATPVPEAVEANDTLQLFSKGVGFTFIAHLCSAAYLYPGGSISINNVVISQSKTLALAQVTLSINIVNQHSCNDNV